MKQTIFCKRDLQFVTYEWAMTHIWMGHATTLGWLVVVGSLNYRSLLQKSHMKQTIFCKRDLQFVEPTNRSHPIQAATSFCQIALNLNSSSTMLCRSPPLPHAPSLPLSSCFHSSLPPSLPPDTMHSSLSFFLSLSFSPSLPPYLHLSRHPSASSTFFRACVRARARSHTLHACKCV